MTDINLWIVMFPVAAAYFFGMQWLHRKSIEWACARGRHDWECGIGPCIDCGAEHPPTEP